MTTLAYIIIFSFLGSVVSLVGGIALLYKKDVAGKILKFFPPFAAGTLLGTAFLDLLPEAQKEAAGTNIFIFALIGFLIFYILERLIHLLYSAKDTKVLFKPVVPLIIFGDSFHNFIDGVAIAITFMVSIPLGIVTSIAVAAHEIPQEIGDFGILLKEGFTRRKVLKVNFFSAAIAMTGAISTYLIGDKITGHLSSLLSITAGFFIYISATNLIPEIHEENKNGIAFWESLLLIVGILVVFASTTFLEH